MLRHVAWVMVCLILAGLLAAGGGHAVSAAPTCTTACYVNAATGNDANVGDQANPLKTIQAGIDAVSPGGTVYVYPGAYNETASNRTLFDSSGPYTFGLFIGQAKSGITVQGVDASGNPITAYANVVANVTTNATNNFGTSGVFVEGDNVTIAGLKILPNAPAGSSNKTIEVIGNGFTLKNSDLADPDGSLYFGDWRYNTGTNTSHIQSYTVQGNLFEGLQLALTNGAGYSGPASGRTITGNTFDLQGNTYPAISFSGSDTGVPWFLYSVGGAVITGNTFQNGTAQYIRARGTYDNSQFDWASYWNNTYDKAVVVGSNPPGTVTPYTYTSGSYTFNNTRHIATTIQSEVTNATAGDTVLVKAGTYSESVTINKALTLNGAGAGSTTLQAPTACTGDGIALSGSVSNVTLQNLTVQGYLNGITPGDNVGSTVSNITLQDLAAINNCQHGIWSQAGVVNGMTVLRVNASNNGDASHPTARGLWVINGTKTNVTVQDGTFNNNKLVGIDISDGSVTGLSITGNTVTGNGDAGISALGVVGPNANIIAANTVTNNGRFGIEVKNATGNGSALGAGIVAVVNNTVTKTVAATDARDQAGIAVIRRSPITPPNPAQPSGVVVVNNTVSGFHRKPSGATGDGFGIVVEGTGMKVQGNTVQDNDVGVQMQSGNTANTQSTLFFDRGDASASSGTIDSNTVSGNTDQGVRILGSSTTADVTKNSIVNNGALGIDLSANTTTADGVTANDALDADTGPNQLQNFPVLTTALTGGGQTTVSGSLNSTANTAFRVEFFANAAADPSGNGEGQTYLGFVNVTTNASGNAVFTAAGLPSVTVGQFVAATATNTTAASPYTSEFSANATAQASTANTVVVRPSNPSGWTFMQEDTPTGSGTYVTGPATPPLGTGSAQLTVDSTGREIFFLAGNAGTKLSDITALQYSTYEPVGTAAPLALSLQFNVDYDVTDADTSWQGRLTFEPYMSGTVTPGVWQTWTPLTGKWWASRAPGNTVCPQNNPCTWSQVLSAFPNAGINTTQPLIMFRAGQWASGFTGNVDAFTLGVGANSTTYDFEPDLPIVHGIPMDFNGDSKSDLLWRNATTGKSNLWIMDGATPLAYPFLPDQPSLDWKPVGMGDLNGDTKADLVWRNTTTGELKATLMNGAAVASEGALPTVADPNWVLAGVGDLNNDGKDDLIWRNTSTREVNAWLMNDTTVNSYSWLPTLPDANWTLVAVGDLDADGQSDLVWRNTATGEVAAWLMNGGSVASYGVLPTVTDLNWKPVASGDLDGDGKTDLVWRNTSTGQVVAWFMNGGSLTSYSWLPTVTDLNWKLVAVGNFNNDSTADLVWRNFATGENNVWLMDGPSVSSYNWLPTVTDADWRVISPTSLMGALNGVLPSPY